MRLLPISLGLISCCGLMPSSIWAMNTMPVPDATQSVMLDSTQSRNFRAWMVRIMEEQLRQGPTPRWKQRDCAGFVRFAVAESLRVHDENWLRSNGISSRQLPPELNLDTAQKTLRHGWHQASGNKGAYASAIELVQANSRFVSRDVNLALPGDLLFFDQGDEQHLMVWVNGTLIYHTGTVTPQDNGLRSIPVSQLLRWKDTRWRPTQENPNFAGIYRLAFLQQ